MKHTLTDFSQLSKAMLKAAPHVDEIKPEPPRAKANRGDEEVLAYFSRSVPNGANDQLAPAPDEIASLHAQLRDAEAARQEAEEKRADAERRVKAMETTLAASQREVERLKGECGRLLGEARKNAKAQPAAPEPEAPLPTPPPPPRQDRGLLKAPASFAEAFSGELREMVIAALADARDEAQQGSRERRATVLDAVLAANPPSGELERRRAALKQVIKEFGSTTDPKALEKLGFRLVSGRTHWKLDYASVRMPIAKTPSDFRSSRNMASDMAKRCF